MKVVLVLLSLCLVCSAHDAEDRFLALGSKDVMPEDCERLSRVKKKGEHCGFSFVCLSGCCSKSNVTVCVEDNGDPTYCQETKVCPQQDLVKVYWRNFWWLTIVIPLIPYVVLILAIFYYMCFYEPPKKRLQID